MHQRAPLSMRAQEPASRNIQSDKKKLKLYQLHRINFSPLLHSLSSAAAGSWVWLAATVTEAKIGLWVRVVYYVIHLVSRLWRMFALCDVFTRTMSFVIASPEALEDSSTPL